MDTSSSVTTAARPDAAPGDAAAPSPWDHGRGDPAVAVRGLTKRYGPRTVVAGVDLVLPRGCVTGLVGPNGAGKTTIMAMLLGLVRPTAGAGTVLGRPLARPAEYLSRVGAVIETPALQAALTGAENLHQLALLGGHDPSGAAELLRFVGLADRAGTRVGAYSLGMTQRLGIAAALLGNPDLVILDEPANGVDPVGMRDLRRMIRGIADRGAGVLVSSHLLGELHHVCDGLVVVVRGATAYNGPLAGLPPAPGEALLVRTAAGSVADLRDCLERAGHPVMPHEAGPEWVTPTPTRGAATDPRPAPSRRRHDAILVPVGEADADVVAARISRLAAGAAIPLTELSHHRADLESRYLALVGDPATPAGPSASHPTTAPTGDHR